MESITANQFIPNQIISTDKGMKMETDMVISCTGSRLNTQFLKNSMGWLPINNNILNILLINLLYNLA